MPTAIRSLATVTATSRGPLVGQEPVKVRSRVPRASPRATARSDPRSMASIPLPRCILRRGPTRATLGKREEAGLGRGNAGGMAAGSGLGEIAPWAVCKEVEWRAAAWPAPDAAWACPAVAWAVCLAAAWRAPDAAWACPVVAWAAGAPMAGGMGGGFRGAPMGGVGGYPGGGTGRIPRCTDGRRVRRRVPRRRIRRRIGGGFGGGGRGGGFGGGGGPRRRGRRPSLINTVELICFFDRVSDNGLQAGRLPDQKKNAQRAIRGSSDALRLSAGNGDGR